MKCEGSFIYKGLESREGGEFINDKGVKIQYEPTYQLKVDEVIDGAAQERTFKFSHKNDDLARKLKNLRLYEQILLSFNIELYKTNIKLVPVDVLCEHEESSEE